MALLESAILEFAQVKSEPPEAVVDYYRATSIVSLVEYSVGHDDIPPAEKVCCAKIYAFLLKLLLCYFYAVFQRVGHICRMPDSVRATC